MKTMKTYPELWKPMKNQPGTMKNHEDRPGTIINHPGTMENHENRPGQGRNKQKRHKQTGRQTEPSYYIYMPLYFG